MRLILTHIIFVSALLLGKTRCFNHLNYRVQPVACKSAILLFKFKTLKLSHGHYHEGSCYAVCTKSGMMLHSIKHNYGKSPAQFRNVNEVIKENT